MEVSFLRTNQALVGFKQDSFGFYFSMGVPLNLVVQLNNLIPVSAVFSFKPLSLLRA
jgi:hypothetical protein